MPTISPISDSAESVFVIIPQPPTKRKAGNHSLNHSDRSSMRILRSLARVIKPKKAKHKMMFVSSTDTETTITAAFLAGICRSHLYNGGAYHMTLTELGGKQPGPVPEPQRAVNLIQDNGGFTCHHLVICSDVICAPGLPSALRHALRKFPESMEMRKGDMLLRGGYAMIRFCCLTGEFVLYNRDGEVMPE